MNRPCDDCQKPMRIQVSELTPRCTECRLFAIEKLHSADSQILAKNVVNLTTTVEIHTNIFIEMKDLLKDLHNRVRELERK